MCRLHEYRVTYLGCKLLKENSILKENSKLSYLLQNLAFSNSQPYEPHLHIHKYIYLCENAPEGTSERTCGTVTDMIRGDTVTEVGTSRSTGQCPACTAAETAIQKECLRVDYVCSPAPTDCIDG